MLAEGGNCGSSAGRRGESAPPPADASAILATLRPYLAGFGITRVGDLTGLDTVGIPVAFAARPNSRSLSVTQGKALDRDAARLGAVMEALEHAFAEREEDLVAFRGTTRELAEAGKSRVDLSRVARLHRAPPGDAPVSWVRTKSLISEAEVYVPLELVGLDLRWARGADVGDTSRSGLGLAAGTSWAAAATHALLEVVEHNATAAFDLFGPVSSFARPVRHRDGTHAALDEIVSRLKRAGLGYSLFDITPSAGLPVIAAFIDCSDLVPGSMRFAGFACRFTPERAAEAALLEAVQSRLTFIAGARDDLAKADYVGRSRPAQSADHNAFLSTILHGFARVEDAPAETQLRAAVDGAMALGAADVLACTLGSVGTLATVVRVIVTGVEASGLNAVAKLGAQTLDALLGAPGMR